MFSAGMYHAVSDQLSWGGWGRGSQAAAPQAEQNNIDFVDMKILKILHYLPFSRNQPTNRLLEFYNMQSYKFSCFIWVRKLVPHKEEGT